MIVEQEAGPIGATATSAGASLQLGFEKGEVKNQPNFSRKLGFDRSFGEVACVLRCLQRFAIPNALEF